MGKEGGEVAGSLFDNRVYSDASLFICFSFFHCLFAFLFFSIYGNKFSMDGIVWISYRITCIILYLFNAHRCIAQSFLHPWREMLKVIAVGLLHCHMTINNYDAALKRFHGW